MIDKNIAGKTITIPGFIIQSEFGALMHASCEMPQHGYVTVMPCPITFTVPADFNPVAAEVAAIKNELDTMADEYHSKVAQLKERMANLLCIEHSVVDAPANPAGDTRSLILGQAVAHHNGEWPESLFSGVMFFNGMRITKEEFFDFAPL